MNRDIVVIGGSAGALDPLKLIAADLPPDLPAAVVVCLHLGATSKSALSTILNRAGGLQVVVPKNGDPLTPGYMYVPTPDHHLELAHGAIHLTREPRVNGARPAVDVLFRSAAATYGPRVTGVVLSGGLDDGTGGLVAIKAAGGVGIVQAPEDASMDSMPRTAIRFAAPDHVLPAYQIGPMITRVVREAAERVEVKVKGGVEMEVVGAGDTPGQVTGITCPDCHGSIWLQVGDGGEVSFACRIGHKYSPESFFEIQAETVENAVWAGVRSLEEQASLAGVMAARALKFDDRQAAERYEKRREIAEANAKELRKLLTERSDDVA